MHRARMLRVNLENLLACNDKLLLLKKEISTHDCVMYMLH